MERTRKATTVRNGYKETETTAMGEKETPLGHIAMGIRGQMDLGNKGESLLAMGSDE